MRYREKKRIVSVFLISARYWSKLGPGCLFHTISPNLGIAYLAAHLRSKGHKVMIFDLQVSSYGQFWRTLREEKPDIVGISCCSRTMRSSLAIAREIRKRAQVTIVMGGPQATNWPRELVVGRYADVVVLGEGEDTLASLAEQVSLSSDWKQVNGIAHLTVNGFILKPSSAPRPCLDDLPFPALDLFDIRRYSPSRNRAVGKRALPIITSRGCPFGCRYCDSETIFGQVTRFRSSTNFQDEVRHWKWRFGNISLLVWDDTFTLNRNHALSICEVLREEKMEWCCTTRPDLVDRELLSAMARAGCQYIYFGAESFSEATLARFNRTTTVDSVREAVRLAHEEGIRTSVGIVTGLPWQRFGDVLMEIRELFRLGPYWPTINLFEPYGKKGLDLLGAGKDEDQWSIRCAFLGLPIQVWRKGWLSVLRMCSLVLYRFQRKAGGLLEFRWLTSR